MGKFESYPEANALGDNDITLYNKNTVTHKITFIRLVNLIKDKISQTGLVTSISAGAGLAGGTITGSGTIKCKLKSETVSSLSSANPTVTADRQYAVMLDREGYLSVNIPWTENASYTDGTAIDIDNNTINVILDNTYSSSSTAKAASAKAVKDAYDNSMRKDGNNADTHVHFSNALTVGTTRKLNSTIGSNSVCFGYGNVASASDSFASGAYTEASGFASHSEGYGTDQPNYTDGQYNEYDSNATANISATAYGSHAEGYTTYDEQSDITGIIQANGQGSHAEGYASGGQGDGVIIAHGKGSHAEGYADCNVLGANCAIIASGDGSHAEGIGTAAKGDASHSEGCDTQAIGDYSHAEGYESVATGQSSHSEGQDSSASGQASHAEGITTSASGKASHTEGEDSVASGTHSHAEGYNTVASGAYSHAGGAHASATLPSQFVQGGYDKKYNSSTLFGYGVFGVSPNAKYYTTDTTINASNGCGATVLGGTEIVLSLEKCSMYMLYWTIYSGTNHDVIYNGINFISTAQQTGLPLVQDMLTRTTINKKIIDRTANNGIILLDDDDYMFHLIRII